MDKRSSLQTYAKPKGKLLKNAIKLYNAGYEARCYPKPSVIEHIDIDEYEYPSAYFFYAVDIKNGTKIGITFELYRLLKNLCSQKKCKKTT